MIPGPHDNAPVALVRHQEWHVTVTGGSPVAWHKLCTGIGMKPLFIELSNRQLQLMMASKFDPAAVLKDADSVTPLQLFERKGFTVVRSKHEVSDVLEGEAALYWEVHLKFDGLFRPDRAGTSRDLFRAAGPYAGRWYLTVRKPKPFDPMVYVNQAATLGKGSTFKGFEYEAALTDTNPSIDKGWA